MITSDNFEFFLECSGFTLNDGIYSHEVSGLQADILNRRLIYPDSIRGHERNTSFDANENFVVFECVHRLLSKGYHPEHIELEKEWHLGHDPKSGRADICVSDESKSVIFIVECKTWGKEFDKAMKDTLNDGAQLFSYWQQESSCKWLVLYTSDIKDDGTIEYKSPSINCSDDENLKLQAEHDNDVKLYMNAESAAKKYEVWNETYNRELHDDVIFSDETSAYDIGIKPLRKRDLKVFLEDGKNKIVNSFEEILRHNNVSDKENAFNRLIALFICKLVDEITKGEDDEVDFQYRHRADSYESLQDRLQRLYTQGMNEFMHEDITYVSSDYPEWLFSNYTSQNREEAIKDLKRTLRKLKFFTNNDFAFKDVHNEELFYQNGKILVEVVQLFSKYRIVHESKHQILGDLFEQLLDKGFKQNEGQFFTPMPITRFIWDSLPLKRFKTWPRVIDYACGAGHFLTEAIEAINAHIESPDENEKQNEKSNSWTRDCIFGIEKDYRLARVSKVSMFMNGAGESNIIFGDGLENTEQIKPGTFDILTANPPYSIATFMQHLKLKNNAFNLLSSLTPSSSEIEVLFVERITQLLTSGGIAAVILPSSILSNDSSCYIGAREEILKNFMIRSIVQFGSKTFGATGTNTVVMFLERYKFPPERYALVKDSVTAILEDRNLAGWEDEKILVGYLDMQGISHEDWKTFIERKAEPETLHEYFRMYLDAFSSRKETQKLKTDRPDEYRRRFYEYARKNEAEKLMYYGLTYTQRTVVILAPSDNAGQKEFLGYDWSSRKGAEGIQYSVRGGKMYVNDDRDAEGTLAHIVRQSFGDDDVIMTEDNARYTRIVRTCEMIDFSRLNFNKAMMLEENLKNNLKSKYQMYPLGSLCRVVIGGTPSRNILRYFTGKNLWVSIAEMRGQVITNTKEKITDEAVKNSNVKLIPKGTTLLSFKLSIGKTAIAGCDLYTNEAIAALIPHDRSKLLDKYLFYIFSSGLIMLGNVGHKAFGKSLNSSYLKEEVMLPLPPMNIQQRIVSECEKINEDYNTSRMSIEDYHEKISALFRQLEVII